MNTTFLIIIGGIGIIVTTIILAILLQHTLQQNQEHASLFAPEIDETHQHASILVKIFGDKINFNMPKYQLVSYWANFEEPYDDIVHIQSEQVTIRHLFETLNFKINENCFTFENGTGFCTDEEYSLKYFVNSNQVSDMQEHEIHDGDRILISYGNETQEEIKTQLDELYLQPLAVDTEHLLRDRTVLIEMIGK